MKNLLIAFLVIITFFSVGYYIGIINVKEITIIRKDSVYIPQYISSGKETLYIHKTDTIINYINIDKPNIQCIPYDTFREDSIIKIFVHSNPMTRENYDSVIVKPKYIIHTDSIFVPIIKENNSLIKWYYIPLAVLLGYELGRK